VRVLGILVLSAILAGIGCAGPGLAAGQPRPERCGDSVADIYERVSPAVVYVTATSINPFQLSNRVDRVVGSGFIFDSSGLILTNSHVVFARQLLTVTLDDGTVLAAQLVGADPIFDVAVLRIPPPVDGRLAVAPPGDSDNLRAGEEVLAIGNPLGLNQTLTRGIVSAINRVLPETPFSLLEPMIQTDAPINPGNSGGPLVNRCGEVIGINTAFMPDAQNIGFAIPINLVKAVIPSLVTKGRVIRPWVGFHGQLVVEPLRSLLRIPLVDGLLVEVIEPGSPAEKAGLRGGQLEIVIAGQAFLVGGDIVTRVNSQPVDSPEKVLQVMRGLKVGETIKLTVFRDGEYHEVEYPLPERPILPGDVRGQGPVAPFTGREVSPPERPILPGDVRGQGPVAPLVEKGVPPLREPSRFHPR
jgi:S1-C subfamily serine protease